jgi:hypothetical protein
MELCRHLSLAHTLMRQLHGHIHSHSREYLAHVSTKLSSGDPRMQLAVTSSTKSAWAEGTVVEVYRQCSSTTGME